MVAKDKASYERRPLVESHQERKAALPEAAKTLEVDHDRGNLLHPDVPREVQLLLVENLAVPACYLMVGLLQGLSRPLLNVYTLDLGASEAQQLTVSSLVTLPATFKILFGFLSDNFPLCGYRRKVYMALGWTLASFSMFVLIFTSDLSLSLQIQENVTSPSTVAPSIQWLSLTFFVFGIGMWMADVAADSIVAEKVRMEPEGRKGHLQSTCYAYRFFGMMVAAPISTFLYSTHGPFPIVLSTAAIPLTMMPLIHVLREAKQSSITSTREQCQEIWKAVCSRAVWQPLGFTYVFNLLQVTNAAWKQFLKTVLGFSAAQLNALLVAAYVLLYAGIMTYKFCLIRLSWRKLYMLCILMNVFVSTMRLFLIRGMTFGSSPFLFALACDAFSEFIFGIQFLPVSIMMVHLCPTGSEGVSYSMYTTVWNSAMMLSPAISTLMLGIWDVSLETLEGREITGLFKLSILASCIQFSSIIFVQWMPHSRVDLEELNRKPYSGSRIGGFLFLCVVAFTILYAFGVGVLNIVKPGWSGGS